MPFVAHGGLLWLLESGSFPMCRDKYSYKQIQPFKITCSMDILITQLYNGNRQIADRISNPSLKKNSMKVNYIFHLWSASKQL